MSDITEFSGAAIVALLVVVGPMVGMVIYGLIRSAVWVWERWWP